LLLSLDLDFRTVASDRLVERRLRMIAIGMTRIGRKNVVNRLNLSG